MVVDEFGDRMKAYEGKEAMRLLDVTKPIMVRLDGRAFSTLTRHMDKPVDMSFRACMSEAARATAEECNAVVAYNQSDEISLVIAPVSGNSQPYFGGRVQKICSILASFCSVVFNNELRNCFYPAGGFRGAFFDCRVWNVPTMLEAANTILWRHQDAVKNSISALAQAHFSHKKLQGLNGQQKIDLLKKERGIDWNDQESVYKYGELMVKRMVEIPFTAKEIDRLPLKHEARKNPNLTVKRSKLVCEPFPAGFGGIQLGKFLFG